MPFDLVYFLVFDGAASSSDSTRFRLFRFWLWSLFCKSTTPASLLPERFRSVPHGQDSSGTNPEFWSEWGDGDAKILEIGPWGQPCGNQPEVHPGLTLNFLFLFLVLGQEILLFGPLHSPLDTANLGRCLQPMCLQRQGFEDREPSFLPTVVRHHTTTTHRTATLQSHTRHTGSG